MGGSPLIQPLPPQVAEVAFGIVTGALGLNELQPSEQVKALVAMPAQELSAKLAGVPFPLAAIIDGGIVKSSPSVSANLPMSQKFSKNPSETLTLSFEGTLIRNSSTSALPTSTPSTPSSLA